MADAETLIELFDELAERARNPFISYLGTPDDRGDWGDEPPTEDDLRAERRLLAAVTLAGIYVIDECITDIQTIGAAELDNDNGQPDPDVYTDTFVWNYFPPRFRPSYDPHFFAKILVTTIKVTQDLASPSADRPACIAEEIITRAICRNAYALMDEASLDYDAVLEDLLLEDADFELLFSKDMDGVENDPAMQRSLGMWIPPVEGWFAPFNDTRVVPPHPSSDHHDLTHHATPSAEHSEDLPERAAETLLPHRAMNRDSGMPT